MHPRKEVSDPMPRRRRLTSALTVLLATLLSAVASGTAGAQAAGPPALTQDAVARCQSLLLEPGLVQTHTRLVGRQAAQVTVAVRRRPAVNLTSDNGYRYSYACAEIIRFQVGLDIVDGSRVPVEPLTGMKFAITENDTLPTKRQDFLRHTRALILPAPLTADDVRRRKLAIRITLTTSVNTKAVAGLTPGLDTTGIHDRTAEVNKAINPGAIQGASAKQGGRNLGSLNKPRLLRLLRGCPFEAGDKPRSASINLGTPSGAIDDGSDLITLRAEWYGPEKKNDPHPGGVDYVYQLRRGARLCAVMAVADQTTSPQVLSRFTPTLSTRTWGYLQDPRGQFGQVTFIAKP